MRNIWTIAKREYDLYFSSPVAYALAAIMLLLLGGYFAAMLAQASSPYSFGSYVPDVTQINSLFAFLLMLFVPALTMRLIADEIRSGTIELMLTSPVSDFEMVTGKWFGGFLFVATIIAITLIYPIILNFRVTPGIDQVTMMTSYIGLILLAGAMLALGTGISAIFSNQIAAFFVSLFVLLTLWWLIGIPASLMQTNGEIFRYLVINSHYDSTFNVGVINLSDILYFLSLIAVGLFTGTMALESRRWR
jgi:ABC-2 type transport system permease protein